MPLTGFSPTIWSSKILRAYDKTLTFGSALCVNRDYEGEIQDYGVSVRIGSVADVTIGNYTKDTDMTPAEVLNGTTIDLIVDQAKFFRFVVDDLDKVQNKPQGIEEATRRANQRIREIIDAYVAGLMVAGATAGELGTVGAPLALTKETAYESLVDAAALLTAKDVPLDDKRFAVVTPAFHGFLQKDSRFVKTDEIRDNGIVGRAAGLNIMVSTQVPSPAANKYRNVVGHADGTSMALQIAKVERYRPEDRFGDGVKGLAVYGAKVTRGNNLALINTTS